MKPIIKVENLGKQYRIGTREAPYGTLRETHCRYGSRAAAAVAKPEWQQRRQYNLGA